MTRGDFGLLSRGVMTGCARLELAQGVVPLNPREAVFEGMLAARPGHGYGARRGGFWAVAGNYPPGE